MAVTASPTGAANSSGTGPVGTNGAPPRTAATPPAQASFQAIVRNTFVETVEINVEEDEKLRRSASDSDLSRSSGDEKMKFWLPSLSSKSSQSCSNSSENRVPPQGVLLPINGSSGAALPLQQWQHYALAGTTRPTGSGGSRSTPTYGGISQCGEALVPNAAASGGAPGLEKVHPHSYANGGYDAGNSCYWQPDVGDRRVTAGSAGFHPGLGRSGTPPQHTAGIGYSQASIGGSPAVRSQSGTLARQGGQSSPQEGEFGWDSKVVGSAGYAVSSSGHPFPHDPARGGSQGSNGSYIEQLHRETGVPINDIQALHQSGVLLKIPRNDRGEFSSIGSIKHSTDECSPCLFWFRKSCAKGLLCDYCHFRHKGQRNKRIRPSKKTRQQMRAHAKSQEAEGSSDEEDEDFADEQSPQSDFPQQQMQQVHHLQQQMHAMHLKQPPARDFGDPSSPSSLPVGGGATWVNQAPPGQWSLSAPLEPPKKSKTTMSL